MTLAVVRLLEAVEVEEENRDLAPVTPRTRGLCKEAGVSAIVAPPVAGG